MVIKNGGNCIIRRFKIFCARYYYGNRIQKGEMRGEFDRHRRERGNGYMNPNRRGHFET
jgi:hypothetical protein